MAKLQVSETTVGGESKVVALVATLLHFLKSNFLLVVPAFIVLRFFYRRYASPLRKYPGPFLASGSRLWKVITTASGHTQDDHIKLHKQYGQVVRIAPNELSFSSLGAAKDIFTSGKGFHKTDFYAVFPPPENPDIFTEPREHVHAQKKRVAMPAYSIASMVNLSPFMDQTEKVLFRKLDGFAGGKKKCDLGAWLHFFAFDVLGEVAFSRNFGFLEAGFDVDNAIKTIDDMQWYNGIIGQVPYLDHLFRRNPLGKYIPFLNTGNALITRQAIAALEERKKSGKKELDRKDILSHLLTGNEQNPDKFGPGDVFAVAHGAIFAGSDSTASTMQSFMWNVLRHPQVHQKIINELETAASNGTIPSSTSSLISYTEALQLPYFQAALKEAMRCRPAVGLNITRHVPPQGAEIDGVWYPGGTRCALNAWVLHKDRAMFGADADSYRPERWLEGSEEHIKKMDRNMFQFGGGSHLCIGRNLALIEMNKVLPQLLRTYKFTLIDPNRELKSNSTFFVVQEGLEVTVEKR